MVSIKPSRTALHTSSRIRDYCEASGVDVVIGTSGESGVGTFATAAIAAADQWTTRNPAEVLMFLDMADDLVEELPRIAGGRLHLPDAPGFGFTIDADKLAALATGTPLVSER
jgi:L-alanine-DL-glutamate epimerase-like enolase superfamily enzyme